MSGRDLEERVEKLTSEVAALKEQMAGLLGGVSVVQMPAQVAPNAADVSGDAGDEILDWMGKSALLPRIAAICFLLVIALVLRTVTDNGILAPQTGSIVGMAYAALLIGAGWYGYRRERPLAPIFTVCGTALMYVIVGETHARFESVPSLAAYALLLLTGGATATISYQSGRPLPVLVGTLGMGLAGVAIDYPTPFYPYLALLLLVGNLFGAFATRLQRCSWLRWMLLILTALMMQVWGMKLAMGAKRSGVDAASLAEPFFLPVLSLLVAVLFAVGILAAVRRGGERPSRFDLCLPTATALWGFSAAFPVLRQEQAYLTLFGLFGLLLAVGAALLARKLCLRGERGRGGCIAYMIAATVLLGMGMWAFTGGVLPVLAVLSLAAWRLAVLSNTWSIGGLRVISYLLQVSCGVFLAVALLEKGPAASPYAQMVAAAMLAVAGLWQYRWCRLNPPDRNTGPFSRLDRDDRSAVLLLMSALVCSFFLLRSAVYLVFDTAGPGAFQAGQSVVVSTAAAVLMIFAFLRRNREIRSVAILVILIAAGRVFVLDLFQVSGVPLVLSILNFGVAVSIISVALTRWGYLSAREAEKRGAGEREELVGER